MGQPHSILYGLSIKHIAETCGVSLKTASRWKAGTICPGYCELAVLTRDLGCFAKEWQGWTVNGPDLVAPSGWCVNRNDALIVPLMHSQIAALRAKIASLEASRDDIEEQPGPGAIPAINASS
jgi:hypothetical protein